MTKRITVLFVFLLLAITSTWATHQRAAEITYSWVTDLTYEFTVTMYTYTPSPADELRPTLPIRWGDNTISDIPRIVFEDQGNDYTLNIYKMKHTFPAAASYTISVEDPNRNLGVVNIPNSVNVPMYVESFLVINPFLGINNSVVLLNPPIDQACVGVPFIHNPAAFDPDGDSLSYRLVNCRGLGGLEIPGFTLPMSSESFAIDALTGDLLWNTPVLQGEYNIAFVVEEWRMGVRVASVERDMQIVVGACDNQAPLIVAPTDTCVMAGDTLRFWIRATDPDNNPVSLSATGGPFEMDEEPAYIYPDPAFGTPTAEAEFVWATHCSHIRKPAYVTLFRARDVNPVVSLTSLKAVNIRVTGPPVQLISAVASGNGADIDWDTYVCSNITGFKLYRKNGPFPYVPNACETGVPAGSGYALVATISKPKSLHYRDEGLAQGMVYCYVVTAVFSDGAESVMSNELCLSLKRDLPLFTHVSNDSTDLASGRLLVDWTQPVDLDTIQYPDPYLYHLQRFEGVNGITPTEVFIGYGLTDTLFSDASVNINTSGIPYSYQVLLESVIVGMIGANQRASSVMLETVSGDAQIRLQWQPKVPWNIDSVYVFRKTVDESQYSLIGKTTTGYYVDNELVNEENYCYYLLTKGSYTVPEIVKPLLNYSQIQCAVPLDNVPPCPPALSVSTLCNESANNLHWPALNDSCRKGLRKFLIYFKPSLGGQFVLIDSMITQTDTNFLHQLDGSTVGCYFVKAVDENGNISAPSDTVCVDYSVCPPYEIPNVITPNGDHINDVLYPKGYPEALPGANILTFKMRIFNRWGRTLFETVSPEISWDGKDQQTGKDCQDGVYFYVCDLLIQTLDGPYSLHLQGSVTIIR